MRACRIVDIVENHIDVDTPLFREAKLIQNRRPLKLVECPFETKACIPRTLNESDNALDQAAREPIVGRLPDLARRPILKAAGIFLCCRRAAIEMDRMLRPLDRLGGDRHLYGMALLKIAGSAVQRDDAVGVLMFRLGAVVCPLKSLERVQQT